MGGLILIFLLAWLLWRSALALIFWVVGKPVGGWPPRRRKRAQWMPPPRQP